MLYWRLKSIPELSGLGYIQREQLLREIVLPRGRILLNGLVPAIVIFMAAITAIKQPHDVFLIVLSTLIFVVLWILVWPPFVIAAMRPSIRRAQQGHVRCHKCGYDLYAIADRCPECGIAPSNVQMELIEMARKKARTA
jgi:ribosomal protein L37E